MKTRWLVPLLFSSLAHGQMLQSIVAQSTSGPTLPVLFYMDGATGTNNAQVTTSNLNAYGSSYCNTGLNVTTANSQLIL